MTHQLDYVGSDKNFVSLSKAELEQYARAAGLELPTNPLLPPWDFYRMMWVLLVIFGIRAFWKETA